MGVSVSRFPLTSRAHKMKPPHNYCKQDWIAAPYALDTTQIEASNLRMLLADLQTTLNAMMTFTRKVSLLLVLTIGFVATSAPEATAQRWVQTAQLLSEIRQESSARALLDTLVQVADRKDIKVKRTQDSEQTLSASDLRSQLINNEGVGLKSANWVFINYRFEIQDRGFKESIQNFQFVYRPPGGAEEDLQVMYVDASAPWAQKVLQNKGTPPEGNVAGNKIFGNQLSFSRLQQRGKIVEISGQTVREGYARKKRDLVRRIQKLTYDSM